MSKLSQRIGAELTEDEQRAAYEEAVERVYRGRQPEWYCNEHGHGDCAFVEDGPCSSEAVAQELARSDEKGQTRYVYTITITGDDYVATQAADILDAGLKTDLAEAQLTQRVSGSTNDYEIALAENGRRASVRVVVKEA